MTYTAEIQTVQAAGISRLKYRTEPPVQSEVCVCFTPTYADDDYAYSAPKFGWGDQVAVAGEWSDVKETGLTEELNFYPIKAIHLVEPTVTVNGKKRLKDSPYWQYGIRDRRCTGELMWFTEEELIFKREVLEEVDEF